MSKTLFLFGNGLSMALSKEFALRNITRRFIDSLGSDDREFFEELCSKEDGLSFDDFEENFTYLESSYESLKKYRLFMDSDIGRQFISKFDLENPQLGKHEEIIERIYHGYISRILELIHGNVRQAAIEAKLSNFVNFLCDQIEQSSQAYIFTLNYDLVVETILLKSLGADRFMDFCYPSGKLKGTDIDKFDFNPRRCEDIFPESHSKVELHHLHGSLSMFYDLDRNRAVKLRSEDIGYEEVYRKIYDEGLPLIPAIITGGGKSDKIVQYPFDYYYRSLKDLCDFGDVSKLYIVGYSFRDDHVNQLINRWTRSVEDYTEGLLIVDFMSSDDEQQRFISFVKKQIKKKKMIPRKCFEFGGAESIRNIEGTQAKLKDH